MRPSQTTRYKGVYNPEKRERICEYIQSAVTSTLRKIKPGEGTGNVEDGGPCFGWVESLRESTV